MSNVLYSNTFMVIGLALLTILRCTGTVQCNECNLHVIIMLTIKNGL